jgi:aspartyl-tRNA(Asn)/glutamyl-tRNA(Gln) amidotransferase subunit A
MKTPTATDLVEQSLAAIAQHGERTNAFIVVDADGARAAAKTVDDERRRGIDRGPIHGMPITIKDLIDIAGQPTTAASKVRANHVATRDATVIHRLRDAGVVIIGKTNLHEFALGTTSEETAYGAVHNPHDPTRSAGGSSGGSAAAVATGMGLASIGSDTGGSIRIPSSACGIVGLKPSLGEVPVDGVVPLCKTFDHVGPITRSVKDAGYLWSVLTDRAWPTFEAPAANALKLGALGGYFTALLEHDVRVAFTGAIEQLRAAGVAIDERTVAGTDTIVDTYVDISLPEAAHWHAATLDAQPGDYQTPVRERLERGRTISAARYLKARDVRDTLRIAVDAALHGPSVCDALVLPTLPIVAPPLGAAEVAMDAPGAAPLAVRAAMLRLTQLFNMTGHPAISLPIRTQGLPVGLQLVGRLGRTEDLLAVATTCERILSN